MLVRLSPGSDVLVELLVYKRISKSAKIGGIGEPKIVKTSGLGRSLGGLGRLWRYLGSGFSKNRRQDELNVGEVSAKLDHDQPKLVHVGVKMATLVLNSGSFGSIRGRCLVDFEVMFGHR